MRADSDGYLGAAVDLLHDSVLLDARSDGPVSLSQLRAIVLPYLDAIRIGTAKPLRCRCATPCGRPGPADPSRRSDAASPITPK